MSKQIKYVKGNVVDALLNGEIDYLIHQVNAQGKFASGVAGEIRQRIPKAYEFYMEIYNIRKLNGGKNLELGSIHFASSGVINLVGQQYYGRDGKRYTNYGALAQGFALIEGSFKPYSCAEEDIPYPYDVILGLPKIGAGLGGGDWTIIEELIQFLLVPYFKEVRVYEL